ncbi:MAG: topoisomerase C-terminal repeat-containing protein, partial [Xanthobacteraceae bacterium]
YGPYVSHAGVNATLPKDKTPENVTLEEAVALLDARAERNPPAPHARPRKAKRDAPAATPKASRASKRPAAEPKRAAASKKSPRKTTQAAE